MNEIKLKVRIDPGMIVIVTLMLCASLLLWRLMEVCPPGVQQPEECFGPLQKFVEEELVCK